MGSTTVPIYLLGGVQLLSLGVIGEYVSKIYAETKGRPRYLIERVKRRRREPRLCLGLVRARGFTGLLLRQKQHPCLCLEPDGKLMRILAQAKRKTLPGRALTIDSSI